MNSRGARAPRARLHHRSAFGGDVVDQNDVAAGLEIAVDLSLRWPFFSLRTTKPLMGQPCQLLIY